MGDLRVASCRKLGAHHPRGHGRRVVHLERGQVPELVKATRRAHDAVGHVPRGEVIRKVRLDAVEASPHLLQIAHAWVRA